MKDLALRKCTPCAATQKPLKGELLKPFEEQLYNGWAVIDEHQLERTYKFKNFKTLLYFVNEALKFQQEINHHASITIDESEVTVQLATKELEQVTEQDLKLAKHFDEELFRKKV